MGCLASTFSIAIASNPIESNNSMMKQKMIKMHHSHHHRINGYCQSTTASATKAAAGIHQRQSLTAAALAQRQRCMGGRRGNRDHVSSTSSASTSTLLTNNNSSSSTRTSTAATTNSLSSVMAMVGKESNDPVSSHHYPHHHWKQLESLNNPKTTRIKSNLVNNIGGGKVEITKPATTTNRSVESAPIFMTHTSKSIIEIADHHQPDSSTNNKTTNETPISTIPPTPRRNTNASLPLPPLHGDCAPVPSAPPVSAQTKRSKSMPRNVFKNSQNSLGESCRKVGNKGNKRIVDGNSSKRSITNNRGKRGNSKSTPPSIDKTKVGVVGKYVGTAAIKTNTKKPTTNVANNNKTLPKWIPYKGSHFAYHVLDRWTATQAATFELTAASTTREALENKKQNETKATFQRSKSSSVGSTTIPEYLPPGVLIQNPKTKIIHHFSSESNPASQDDEDDPDDDDDINQEVKEVKPRSPSFGSKSTPPTPTLTTNKVNQVSIGVQVYRDVELKQLQELEMFDDPTQCDWEFAVDENMRLYRRIVPRPVTVSPPPLPPPAQDKSFSSSYGSIATSYPFDGMTTTATTNDDQQTLATISTLQSTNSRHQKQHKTTKDLTTTIVSDCDDDGFDVDEDHIKRRYSDHQPSFINSGGNQQQQQHSMFITATATNGPTAIAARRSTVDQVLPSKEPPMFQDRKVSLPLLLSRQHTKSTPDVYVLVSDEQSNESKTVAKTNVLDSNKSHLKLPNGDNHHPQQQQQTSFTEPNTRKNSSSTKLRNVVSLLNIATTTTTTTTTGGDHTPTTGGDDDDDSHRHRQRHHRDHHRHRRHRSLSMSMSSMISNRFESLLRHGSFLRTAMSSALRLNNANANNANTSRPSSPSPKLLQSITDHRNGVNCIELSEDRSLLVSGGEDGVLRLWSTFATPCECIGVLVGHKSYITCCTVYRYMIISGSADCTVKLWSIENGNCLATLTGHSAFVNRVVCYGPLLLSTSFDGTCRIWTLVDQLTMVQYIKVSSSSGGDHDGDDGGGHGNESGDDKDQQSSQGSSSSNLINRKSLQTSFGACFHTLTGHSKSITQVAIISTDATCTLLNNSGIIQELDIVITTSTDGTARTWNLSSGEPRHTLAGHQGPINCLAVDPKETQFVYTAGADWIIKCWDVITGEHLRDLRGHQNAILCLLSHNRILYSGSADNTVRAWAMEFGQCTRVFYRNTNAITTIQYYKGVLYTGSNDHCARLYDSTSGVLKQTYKGHRNAIIAVRVIPGKLFTASFDGRILVWDCTSVQHEIQFGTSGGENSGTAQQNANVNNLTNIIKAKLSLTNHSRLLEVANKRRQQKIGSNIGISLLNSTLGIFPDENKEKLSEHEQQQQDSYETLYPHLFTNDSDECTQMLQDKVISGILKQTLKKKKRKSTKMKTKTKTKTSNHHDHDRQQQQDTIDVNANMLPSTTNEFNDNRTKQKRPSTVMPSNASDDGGGGINCWLNSIKIWSVGGNGDEAASTTTSSNLDIGGGGGGRSKTAAAFLRHRCPCCCCCGSGGTAGNGDGDEMINMSKHIADTYHQPPPPPHHIGGPSDRSRGRSRSQHPQHRSRSQIAELTPGNIELNQSIRALIDRSSPLSPHGGGGGGNRNHSKVEHNDDNGDGGDCDDSANVKKAINALEPYLRSFK